MRKIGIDIDDCLAVNMPQFLKRVKSRFGIDIPITSLIGPSHKTEDYGFTTLTQVKSLQAEDAQKKFLLNLSVHKNSVSAVNAIADKNQVILVTSRNNYDLKLLVQHTKMWLKLHGFNYHHLLFTQDKGQAAKDLQLDILIDDSLKFAEQAVSQGFKVILYAQPWNQSYKNYLGPIPSKSVVARCEDWADIAKIINKEYSSN